jgi:hypothetical protein
LNSKLAPGRRFELRTLRLTDRRRPFRNRDLNSPSAAEYRQIPPFATGVAVRQSQRLATATRLLTLITVLAREAVGHRRDTGAAPPSGGQDNVAGMAGWLDRFTGWLPSPVIVLLVVLGWVSVLIGLGAWFPPRRR